MNNEIEIFSNSEFGEMRTIETENGPMFCLLDICKALGLSDPTTAKRRLMQNGMKMVDLANLTAPLSTRGEKVHADNINTMSTFIDEPNLYRLIFQSKKESAVRFQNWVFEEVLPKIRKNGFYANSLKLLTQVVPISVINQIESSKPKRTKRGYKEGFNSMKRILEENGYQYLTTQKVFKIFENFGIIKKQKVEVKIEKVCEISFIDPEYVEQGYAINSVDGNEGITNNQILFNESMALKLLNLAGINLANEEFLAKRL